MALALAVRNGSRWLVVRLAPRADQAAPETTTVAGSDMTNGSLGSPPFDRCRQSDPIASSSRQPSPATAGPTMANGQKPEAISRSRPGRNTHAPVTAPHAVFRVWILWHHDTKLTAETGPLGLSGGAVAPSVDLSVR
jgi:hypothetical protein